MSNFKQMSLQQKQQYANDNGKSKNRESLIVFSNSNDEVALVKIITSQNSKYKIIPNYNNYSKCRTEDIHLIMKEIQ